MPITADDVQAMVSHWLGCPPNGYLGSGYGSGVEDLLHTPLAGPEADRLIAKLRSDVRIVGLLDGGAVNLLAQPEGPDKLKLFFEVAGALIPVEVPPAES